MKKLLSFTCVIISFFHLKSQTIPNGGFETWINTPYYEPNPWITSNPESIQDVGAISVWSVTGVSGKGIHLETKAAGTTTTTAYILNTDKDILSGEGGLPFTQKPGFITGSWKYNLLGNDTAFMWIMFKKSGSVISNDFIKIRGTGTVTAWTSFSYSLSLTQTPDSVIIAIASSDVFGGSAVPGSYLELDQLAFTGTAITQTIQGGNFETLTSKNHEKLADWTTNTSEYTSKTGNAFAGASAISMTTASAGTFVITTRLTNGSFCCPSKGRPYNLTQDTLIGYYKYTTSGQDSAAVILYLTKNASYVAGFNAYLKGKTTWTQFKIPISTPTPDSMRIEFESASWPYTSTSIGTVLFLDNIYLKSQPVGLTEQHNHPFSLKSFPNPTGESLTIEIDESILHATELKILDMNGRVLMERQVGGEQKNIKVDVGSLEAGVYFYSIHTDKGILKNKFIKQ